MDSYKVTVVLDNRMSIPVGLRLLDVIAIKSVRANGVEMSAGFLSLPETYEVRPGKTTIVRKGTDAATILHSLGSAVTEFKLSGDVSVTNSYPDQLSRGKFCEYRDMEMGAPLRGSWGS